MFLDSGNNYYDILQLRHMFCIDLAYASHFEGLGGFPSVMKKSTKCGQNLRIVWLDGLGV